MYDDEAQFYLQNQFDQKKARSILSIPCLQKEVKCENISAVFGTESTSVAVFKDRILYRHFVKGKFLPRYDTVYFKDVSDIGYRQERGCLYVYMLLKDQTNLKLDISATTEAAQPFFNFLKNTFRQYLSLNDVTPELKSKMISCRACGADIVIQPNGDTFCEYCGTRYQ